MIKSLRFSIPLLLLLPGLVLSPWAQVFSQTASPYSSSGAERFYAQSGVIQVSSKYVDEATREQIHEVGSGIVVQVPETDFFGSKRDRYVLMTTSHLSQGLDLRIHGQSSETIALGRRTDNFTDLDIIEIDPQKLGVKPFAKYDPETKKFIPFADSFEPWTGSRRSTIGGNEKFTEKDLLKRVHQYIDKDPALAATYRENWKHWSSQSDKYILTESESTSVPGLAFTPEWSRRRTTEDANETHWESRLPLDIQAKTESPLSGLPTPNNSEIHRRNQSSYTAFGNQVWAPVRVAPGMSGGPATYTRYDFRAKEEETRVRGLASEFIADMTGSSFVSDRAMSRGLDEYLRQSQGKTVTVDPTKWKFYNHVAYRDMGDGTSEIVPLTSRSGGANTVPPGGANTVPPGGANTVPPGGANTVPPGLAGASQGSQDIWESKGLLPAFSWKGKVGIGFKVTLVPGGEPIYLLPNTASYDFVRRFKDRFASFEVIAPGSDLTPLIQKKFNTKLSNFVSVSGTEMPCISKQAKVQKIGDQIQISFYSPLREGDPEVEETRVILDNQGRLLSPQTGKPVRSIFQPRIDIKSPSGKPFVVDLGELFFTDLSTIVFDLGRGQELGIFEEIIEDKGRGMAQLNQYLSSKGRNLPYLNFRPQNTFPDYRLSFAETQPYDPAGCMGSCTSSRQNRPSDLAPTDSLGPTLSEIDCRLNQAEACQKNQKATEQLDRLTAVCGPSPSSQGYKTPQIGFVSCKNALFEKEKEIQEISRVCQLPGVEGGKSFDMSPVHPADVPLFKAIISRMGYSKIQVQPESKCAPGGKKKPKSAETKGYSCISVRK